jgi:hypothetical protein
MVFHRWGRRREMDDWERCWEPFSIFYYSTVTLLAKFRG